MTEREIHRIIEEQNPEEKQASYQKLKSRLDIPDAPTKPTKRKIRNPWIVSIAAVCACVLCLAIVLPIVLLDGRNSEKFVDVANGVDNILDCTLADYAKQTNQAILYVDWYDVADAMQTSLLVNKDDPSDIYFIYEFIVNGETGDLLNLYVTDSNTRINSLESFHENCKSKYTVGKVTVKWGGTGLLSQAIFEYQGYRYYIEIAEGGKNDLVKEIIEGMLK